MIEEALRLLNDENIETLYSLFTGLILGNIDFTTCMEGDDREVYDMIREMTEKEIPFSLEDLLTTEERVLFDTIYEYEKEEITPDTDTMRTLAAEILMSDTFLEAICIGYFGSEKDLGELARFCGCGGRYQALSKDAAYQMRRKYIQTITKYAMAAVNLYGVIHLGELMELIENCEKKLMHSSGYEREQGNYRHTFMFSPEWWCTYTAHNIVGNLNPAVAASMEGLILNPIFVKDLSRENEKLEEYLDSVAEKGKTPDLDEFYEGLEGISYRDLYRTAGEKPPFVPPKKEMLRYADPEYYEESLAEKQFRKVLKTKWADAFEKTSEECGFTVPRCEEICMRDIHWTLADHVAEPRNNPTGFIQDALRILNDYHIEPGSKDELDELVGHLVKISNSVRLWRNHGLTPAELGMMRKEK